MAGGHLAMDLPKIRAELVRRKAAAIGRLGIPPVVGAR